MIQETPEEVEEDKKKDEQKNINFSISIKSEADSCWQFIILMTRAHNQSAYPVRVPCARLPFVLL